MSTITRTSDHSIEIGHGLGRSRLTLISSGLGKHRNLTVNISGPRGGNQQAILVSASDVLEALDDLDAIDETTALNYADIILDGLCPACHTEIPEGDIVCNHCLQQAMAAHAS